VTVHALLRPDLEAAADERRAAIDAAVQRALGRFACRATLDVPEVGELFGIGRTSAYELLRSGQLRGIRVGRRLVVGVPEIVALLLGADP
jgi:hypothetical protein